MSIFQSIKNVRARHSATIFQNYQGTQNINIDGSSIGKGIYDRDAWLNSSRNGRQHSSESRDRAIGPHAIHRVYEDEVLERVHRWIRDSDKRTLQTITISGKHGTGLSWLLYRVANALQAQRNIPPVYVVDDRVRFAKTQLDRLFDATTPVILLIDDADLQQALNPLELALDLPILAICTGTDRPYLDILRGLFAHGNEAHIELPFWPQLVELIALEDAYGNPPLSQHDKEFIRSGTLRSAARRLGSGDTVTDTAERLVRSVSGVASRFALEILLASTSENALIPQTLLLRACKTDRLPDDVNTWVHWSSYLEGNGESSRFLWVEDQEVAERAREILDAQADIAPAARIMSDVDIFSNLVEISSESPYEGEADFIRGLLKNIQYEIRDRVVRQASTSITKLIGKEARSESLISWLSLASSVNAEALVPVDVGSALSNCSVSSLLLALMGDSASNGLRVNDSARRLLQWNTDDWRLTIELVERLPNEMKSRAVRRIAPVLRQQDEQEQVLRAGGVLQSLIKMFEARAEYQDREWLLRRSLEISPRSHVSQDLFTLAERCMTQGRSALAIELLRAHLDGKEFSEARKEYQKLEDAENGNIFADRVTDWCANELAADRPSKAAQNWHHLLTFSSNWSPELFDYHWETALLFLDSAHNDIPLYARRNFLRSLSLFFARGNQIVSVERHRYILDGLHWRSNATNAGPINVMVDDAQRYVNVIAGHALSSEPLGVPARNALTALFIYRGRELHRALVHFNEQASDMFSCRLQVPDLLFRLNRPESSPVIYTLVSANRNISSESQTDALSSAHERWLNVPSMRGHLIYWALRSGQMETYMHLVSGDGSASDAARAAAAFAATGDIAKAEESLRKMLRARQDSSVGAHLHAVHRAAHELAKARRGASGTLYRIVENLASVGPLDAFPNSSHVGASSLM